MKVTQEDYNAGLLALQVYDRIHTRSPFGRATTLVENAKWDNGRKVLAYYEAHLAIDEPWKKANRDRFISDSGEFLNRLNEAYHKDGYHIGMTGITEGTIYVARDAENNNYEYNSSEGEYMYEQECAYRQYLINKANCQRQLRGMVVEAAILSDNQISISEKVDKLYALNEGLGDSVKDAWGKFKAFLSKIWQKFSEFIARTVNTDKGYLERYKDIILHRKWKDDQKDLEIDAQYTVGITRLSQFTVATPTADDVNNKLTGNDDTDLKFYQKKLMPAYGSNTTVEFPDFCKHWFKGGDGKGGKHNLTSGEINFTDMYNFCYNYKKIYNNLNKNQGIMQNAATVFENAAKEAMNKEQTPTPKTPSPAPKSTGKIYDQIINNKYYTKEEKAEYDALADDPANTPNGKTKAEKQKEWLQKNPGQDTKTAPETNSFKYRGKLGTFILEDVTTSSSGGGTTASPSNFGNMNTKAGSVRQMADTSTRVDKQEEADLTKKLGFFTSASGDLFAAMCTAAETIKKDYMKIIKMHVQSYLGEDKDSENKTAQQTGTNRTVNITYTDAEKAFVTKPDTQKGFGGAIGLQSLNSLKTLEQSEDPNEKAKVNEFLNYVANLHKSQNGGPMRTYSSISDYEEAIKAQVPPEQKQETAKEGEEANANANPLG